MSDKRDLRKTLIPAAIAAAFTGGALIYLYSRHEARRYRLERLKLSIITDKLAGKKDRTAYSGTPGELGRANERRFSILHLSDLHLCVKDTAKVDFLQEVTEGEYDLVVLTGDIFEEDDSIVHASALLKAKPRLGAFAVLGNHDHFKYSWFDKTIGRFRYKERRLPRRDVKRFINCLEAVGYKVLQNEAVRLPNHALSVIGIDYPFIEEERLQELVKSVDKEDLLLALFHLPYNLAALERAGVQIAFGGHTHGGQIRIPGYGAIFTDSELPGNESAGLIWRGSTAIHISRGLGTDPRTNFRFFCPPAATVLEVAQIEVPSQTISRSSI